ncbi:MAG: hypothetical protein ABIU09_12785 [Pyrinomonadaceae bacterium]
MAEITCAADFADWYDGEARQFKEEVLTDFVHNNPGFFGVFVAGVVSTQFEVGSVFFVDIARLGTGAAEGSAKGIFQDVLRALSVIPAGKIPTVAKPILARIVRILTNLFRWRKVEGGLCIPISIAQALQHTGQKLVVSLDEILTAMGKKLDDVFKDGATQKELIKALTEMKAVFSEIPMNPFADWNAIKAVAEGTEGVVIIRLELFDTVGKFLAGHKIVVSKTLQGTQIIDRYGVFKNLDDLSRHYGGIFKIDTAESMVIIKNWVFDPALARRLNIFGPLGAMVVRVGTAFGFNPYKDAKEIKAKFRDYIAALPPESLYPPPTRPPETVSVMGVHTIDGPGIQKKDWLSSIAGQWYGDLLLWPALWDFNKGPEFTNPNKMYVGQRIKIPFLDKKSSDEIMRYKQRGYNWQGESWK